MDVTKDFMWAYLLHLGYNISYEKDAPYRGKYSRAGDSLRCDKELWDELLEKMAEVGVNTVVVDLNEGVKYESHPEIGVEGAWSVDTLGKEIEKMRKLGLKPIPKLNFSACHDVWLGEYSRCLSTDLYYKVCSNLINEVIDIFDTPEFFHIGMDEENYSNQRFLNFILLRQGDLWWHDFNFLVDTIEKRGVRAWIWGDRARDKQEEFIEKMPKSVLISDWCYLFRDTNINDVELEPRRESFKFLSRNGYEQAPAGSNWSYGKNLEILTKFSFENLSRQSLKGMFQTVWYPTLMECRYKHLEALESVKYSIEIAKGI